jgi:hypothetical protein
MTANETGMAAHYVPVARLGRDDIDDPGLLVGWAWLALSPRRASATSNSLHWRWLLTVWGRYCRS